MVIETLSHSKVAMLSKCPRQFYYRYILGYKIPPNAFRNFGGAYHKTLEANFKHKVESGNDMSIEQVKDIFTDEWKSASAEVEWNYEDEREENFSNRGVDLVGTYVKDIAPKRNPSHVEYEFKVSLPEIDRPFVGVIDLVLQENYMSDHKTSTRRWPKDRANNELQPTAYYLAFEEDFGVEPKGFVYDIAPRTGKPQIQVVQTARTQVEKSEYLERLKIVEDSIEKENYPKTNPSNWYCSSRWCGYYGACMQGIPPRQLRLQETENDFQSTF